MTAWLLAALGAKKEGGRAFDETDIFPELKDGPRPDGRDSGALESARVLSMFQAMAHTEQLSK